MNRVPKCPVCQEYMDYDDEANEWFCLDSCDGNSFAFMEIDDAER